MFEFIQSILDLGPVVVLPIMITLLGVFFRMKFGQALKAGLFVGIGFQGIQLIVGLLMTAVDPAIQHYKELGSGFTTVDVGWAAIGGASWGVSFAPIAVILIILINIILIRIGWTNVMNIDIWNFIHYLIPGAMAYALFGSAALGLSVTVILSIITLFVADKIAPKWESYYGLEGTTCTTFSFITMTYPIAWFINKIIDRIPGLRNIDFELEELSDKLGVLGQTSVIGIIVGLFLGVLTSQPFTIMLTMGIQIAAVLTLLPKMVGVMMEGLSSIGSSAQEYMKSRISEDRELIIGMDIALSLGDPTNVTLTVLSIPLVILYAFLIPNISYFPVGILTVIVYVIPMITMACKGNVFRTYFSTAVILFITVFFADYFAPAATKMMQITGVEVTGQITDAFFGFNIANIIIGFIAQIF